MHCFIVFDLVKDRPAPSLKTLTKDKKFLISDFGITISDLEKFIISQPQFL